MLRRGALAFLLSLVLLTHFALAATPAPSTVPAEMQPGELAGVVVDADGKPIEGALVDVWTWHKGNETKTDADGRFALRKLDRDDPVEVRISKDGFGPWYVEAQPTGVGNLIVRLSNNTYFEGIVKGPDGKPAAGALVRADSGPKRNPGVHISTVWTETSADANGRYRLHVAPDSYEFHVRVPGVGATRVAKTPIAAGEARKLDLQLEHGSTLNVQVIDSITAKPVPGVRLYVWEHKGIDGTSDANGHIVFDGLQPGILRFQVEAKGHARWWSADAVHPHQRLEKPAGKFQRNFDDLEFKIERGILPVTVEVERAVTITGTAIDPDGKPVAGATVAPAKTGSGNSLTGDTRFSVTTKEDGTFTMSLPASGEMPYNLVVHDGKYGQWRNWANGVNEPFTARPGDTITGVTMRLKRPSVVRGRAVDAETGEPVADREVRAHAADKRENRYYDPTTRTDKVGRFELKFVRPGEQFIQVAPFWLTAEQAPAGSTVTVTLKEGETKTDVDLKAAKRD